MIISGIARGEGHAPPRIFLFLGSLRCFLAFSGRFIYNLKQNTLHLRFRKISKWIIKITGGLILISSLCNDITGDESRQANERHSQESLHQCQEVLTLAMCFIERHSRWLKIIYIIFISTCLQDFPSLIHNLGLISAHFVPFTTTTTI